MNQQLELEKLKKKHQTIIKSLFKDLENGEDFSSKYLAHYTSISNIEDILKTKEIWFSNPLLMNDRKELRFGILESRNKIYLHKELKDSCGSDNNFNNFIICYPRSLRCCKIKFLW